MANALRYQAEALALRARWLARERRARGEDFEAAASAFQRATEADPEWQEFRLFAALLDRDWGSWLARSGVDPTPALRQGLKLLEEALAARPQWAHARAAHAGLLLMLAETPASPQQQRDWRREAREELTQALASNPPPRQGVGQVPESAVARGGHPLTARAARTHFLLAVGSSGEGGSVLTSTSPETVPGGSWETP
ncbi:hypothetical protein [Archangium lansingense]|uniref:Tetratricopeptide repeat protein n=1 Tax=Archangium lansingense TaxID=2995310 RepID=A0ABT3ZWP6_9BACT|nr:hypothetical protein [Archangium lansinium]MCY1073817.1 hypothetical protein [Archangium lansinium]